MIYQLLVLERIDLRGWFSLSLKKKENVDDNFILVILVLNPYQLRLINLNTQTVPFNISIRYFIL